MSSFSEHRKTPEDAAAALQRRVEGFVFGRLRTAYAEIAQGAPDNTKLEALATMVARELIKMRNENE